MSVPVVVEKRCPVRVVEVYGRPFVRLRRQIGCMSVYEFSELLAATGKIHTSERIDRLLSAWYTILPLPHGRKPGLRCARSTAKRVLPPNAINDLLTRRALDEALRLADYRDLNRVSHALLEVVVALLPCALEQLGVRAGVDLPARRERERELEHVARVHAEGTNGEDFAERGARARERDGDEVAVAQEVGAVEEEAEDDG